MRYDVIVVGAGPAGSTAARECVARGLSVLILDRATFPRDKPCGGGVTVRAAHLLPFDLEPVTERVAFGMRISIRRSRSFTRRAETPITFLTQRRRLDAYLLQRAIDAGAIVHEGTAVNAVEQLGTHVVLRSRRETFEARTVVGADGVNGAVARLANIAPERWMTVALEGNITPNSGVPDEWTDVMGMDTGDSPGGYGWLFPKGDHVNIGLATMRHAAPTLRRRLDRLTQAYGFDPADFHGLRGYHLPTRRPGAPLVGGRIVLVGDAAGLIDPLTLEGIHAALWSGRASAPHLSAFLDGAVPNLCGYARQVEKELWPDLQAARRFYELSSLLGPSTWMEVARRMPRMWDLMWRLLRGEQSYSGAYRRLGHAALGLDWSTDLLRAAPLLQRRAYNGDPPLPERLPLPGYALPSARL